MRPFLAFAPLLSLLLAGSPAPLAAQSEPDRNPVLLRLDVAHGNIFGPHYFTSVIVLNGGAVATTSSCGSPDRPDFLESTVGQIEPAPFTQLQQVLSAQKIGQQSGSCGSTPRGGPARYFVTWFGKNGRSSAFSVGGFPSSCPAAQTRILDAILVALVNQKAVPTAVNFGDLSDCP